MRAARISACALAAALGAAGAAAQAQDAAIVFERGAVVQPLPQDAEAAAETSVAGAQPDYDDYLRRTMDAYDSTGMVAAVMVDGRTVYTGARGKAEEGTQRRVTRDTLFPIASISKAFTTTALAILVDREQVDWDAPVKTYIPEFAMWDPWVGDHFTVRDLLTHRSGLPLGAGDLLIWPDGNAKVDDIIAALPHLRPSTGFRDGYAYDNLLYIVAGEIVARVSGQSWPDFVTQEILQPVGLTRCAAQKDRIPAGADVVTGHERAAGAEDGVPIDPRAAFSNTWSAAGGLYCTASDMMAWSKFWFDGGVAADGTRIVSEEQARELWQGVTPMGVNGRLRSNGSSHLAMYALGWVVQDFEGRLMVSHSGGAPGVASNLLLLPEEDIAVFASSNDYRGSASTFTHQVANALVGRGGSDFITDWGAAFAEAEAEGAALISETAGPPADATPPSLALAKYAGTYRDPWYGEVRISLTDDGALFIDMGRSEILDGKLTHFSGDRFTAFWPDASLKADAYVDFETADGAVTGMTMKAISELTDFSYDFHDLKLERVD